MSQTQTAPPVTAPPATPLAAQSGNPLTYLLDRLREPSTWAAIAALLVAFHGPLAQGVSEHITTTGTAIAGLLGVLLGERTTG